MSIYAFDDYVKSLSPAMCTMLLKGMPECLDAYNRPRVTNTGATGPVYRKDGKGWGFGNNASCVAGGGSVSIVDSGAAPELRAASGTLLWMSPSFQTAVPDYVTATKARVYSKSDLGGADLEVFVSAANTLTIYDGTSLRTAVSTSLVGAKTVAFRWVSGGVPQLYTNGVFRVNASGTLTPPGDDADLYLANYRGGSYGSRVVDYGGYVLFNDAVLGRAITPQEIANLHEVYVEILSVFEPQRTIFLPPDPPSATGIAPVVYFAGSKNESGIVPDLSGNGRDFTVTGRLSQQGAKTGKIIHTGYGVGGTTGPLAQTAVDAALYADPWTVSCKFFVRSVGEGNSGHPFMVDSAAAIRCRSYPNVGATLLYYLVTYADGEAVWSFPCVGGVQHVVSIRHDKSSPLNVPQVSVDGAAVTVTTVTPRAGALIAAPSARLSLFNFYSPAAAARAFDGDIEVFRIDSGLLTDAQVRKIYLQHALECTVLSHRTDYAVSPAAVAAGGYAGPWRVLQGTMRWEDTAVRRRLVAATTAYYACPSPTAQAYGAWYFRASKGTDAGLCLLPLVANAPVLPAATNFNGYVIYIASAEQVIIRRYIAGVSTNIATSAAGAVVVGTEYEFFVTRQSVADAAGHAAGYWTVWIRGGAYATWTSLLTGTDNTHTTGTSLVGYSDVGGTLSDYRLYPNGATLLPTELP